MNHRWKNTKGDWVNKVGTSNSFFVSGFFIGLSAGIFVGMLI
ncbi:hypothetical protein [Pseudoalteromonas sp. SR43-7]|nr:hypothetical protein [Pseudoalteromonas sp. SR43-7]